MKLHPVSCAAPPVQNQLLPSLATRGVWGGGEVAQGTPHTARQFQELQGICVIWVPSPPSRPKRNELKSCLIEMDLIRNHILSPCEVELWFEGAISKVAFLYLMLLDTPGCENEGLEVGRRGNKKAQNSLLVLSGVVN